MKTKFKLSDNNTKKLKVIENFIDQVCEMGDIDNKTYKDICRVITNYKKYNDGLHNK